MMRLEYGESAAAGEALWRFSLALYARPDVADALISMQDRAGSDVNVILFGLWLGVTRGRLLGAAGLRAAEAAIAPINRSGILPLRRLRRALKPAGDPALQALRRRIAGLEIATERQALYRLAASLGGAAHPAPGGDRIAAAEANLALILGDLADAPEAGAICRALAALIHRV